MFFVLFRLGPRLKEREKIMKTSDLKKRLRKDRPMTTVSLQIPEDVCQDLKRVAPLWGFSDYTPLIRAYIGQGLREDLAKLDAKPDLTYFINSLRRHGVDDGVIALAISDVNGNQQHNGGGFLPQT